MYNVDVKEAIERLIGYFMENETKVREDGLVDISVYGSKISSLEEVGYMLVVEVVRIFDCRKCNNLKSLRGSPSEVYGSFFCGGCDNLESLEGGPEYVKGNFYCRYCNKLKDLRGGPKVVEGDFNCSDCNGLISLEGGPREVYGDFVCDWCKKLREIKFDVKEILKDLSCVGCESLEYIDEDVISKVGGKVYVKGCEKVGNIIKLKKKFGNKIERKIFCFKE